MVPNGTKWFPMIPDGTQSWANPKQIQGKYQANLGQIMGKFGANLRQISGISRAHLGQLAGKSLANLRQILGKSWANLRHISDKFSSNLGCISDISQVLLKLNVILRIQQYLVLVFCCCNFVVLLIVDIFQHFFLLNLLAKWQQLKKQVRGTTRCVKSQLVFKSVARTLTVLE